MDTCEKDVEYMLGSDFNVDVEQVYQEEAVTKIFKKKHPKYIAPQSMKRYANLAQKRFNAPNVSRVLTSLKSHMQKGQVIDTRREINSRVLESDEGHKRGRSIVAKQTLFAVDNNDEHRERDMRFHDIINEEQHDCENDDIENIDMNEPYEEQDSSEDDGERHG